MRALQLLVVFLVLPASACAQQSAETDSTAVEAERAFVEACLETSNLSEALCTCAAKKAKAELSETGYNFLLATLQQDDEETERLRGEMDIQEAMQAGMFLARAPAECARDGN